jgi:hypothetical protein
MLDVFVRVPDLKPRVPEAESSKSSGSLRIRMNKNAKDFLNLNAPEDYKQLSR